MKAGAAGWMFAGPALIVIAVFFALPVLAALALSVTDFDIYALADSRNLRFMFLEYSSPQVCNGIIKNFDQACFRQHVQIEQFAISLYVWVSTQQGEQKVGAGPRRSQDHKPLDLRIRIHGNGGQVEVGCGHCVSNKVLS